MPLIEGASAYLAHDHPKATAGTPVTVVTVRADGEHVVATNVPAQVPWVFTVPKEDLIPCLPARPAPERRTRSRQRTGNVPPSARWLHAVASASPSASPCSDTGSLSPTGR